VTTRIARSWAPVLLASGTVLAGACIALLWPVKPSAADRANQPGELLTEGTAVEAGPRFLGSADGARPAQDGNVSALAALTMPRASGDLAPTVGQLAVGQANAFSESLTSVRANAGEAAAKQQAGQPSAAIQKPRPLSVPAHQAHIPGMQVSAVKDKEMAVAAPTPGAMLAADSSGAKSMPGLHIGGLSESNAVMPKPFALPNPAGPNPVASQR
jgi:hypothetical protein